MTSPALFRGGVVDPKRDEADPMVLWPITIGDDFCGGHPDIPAYLAATHSPIPKSST